MIDMDTDVSIVFAGFFGEESQVVFTACPLVIIAGIVRVSTVMSFTLVAFQLEHLSEAVGCQIEFLYVIQLAKERILGATGKVHRDSSI